MTVASRRVKVGDPITEGLMNRILDAVTTIERMSVSGNASLLKGPAGYHLSVFGGATETIQVKNVSGSTIQKFSLLYVSGHSGKFPEVKEVDANVFDNGPPILLTNGKNLIKDQAIGRVLPFTKPRRLKPDTGTPAFGEQWGIFLDSFGVKKDHHGLIALSGDLGDGTFLFDAYDINSMIASLTGSLSAGSSAAAQIFLPKIFAFDNFSITAHGSLVRRTLDIGTLIIVRWIAGQWEVVNADVETVNPPP